MEINKNKETHFPLSFASGVIGRSPQGQREKVTPQQPFWLCKCAVMDTFPQGIIGRYGHNDVSLSKRRKMFGHLCQLNIS